MRGCRPGGIRQGNESLGSTWVATIKLWASRALTLALVVVLARALWGRYTTYQRHQTVVGTSLKNLVAADLDGNRQRLPRSSGPFVLVFWASWCGPCTVELGRINDAIADGDLPAEAIYALSLDDSAQAAAQAAADRNYRFSVYWNPDHKWARKLAVTSTPTAVFVDESGRVQDVEAGMSLLPVQEISGFLN